MNTIKTATSLPCHSIHCRHYDLAHGQKCIEQVRREAARRQFIAAHAQGKK